MMGAEDARVAVAVVEAAIDVGSRVMGEVGIVDQHRECLGCILTSDVDAI